MESAVGYSYLFTLIQNTTPLFIFPFHYPIAYRRDHTAPVHFLLIKRKLNNVMCVGTSHRLTYFTAVWFEGQKINILRMPPKFFTAGGEARRGRTVSSAPRWVRLDKITQFNETIIHSNRIRSQTIFCVVRACASKWLQFLINKVKLYTYVSDALKPLEGIYVYI